MEVQIYRIMGKYRGKRGAVEFSKEIRATCEDDALEHLYSELGSKHRVKRASIIITKIALIKAMNEVTNPVVLRLTIDNDVSLTKERK